MSEVWEDARFPPFSRGIPWMPESFAEAKPFERQPKAIRTRITTKMSTLKYTTRAAKNDAFVKNRALGVAARDHAKAVDRAPDTSNTRKPTTR